VLIFGEITPKSFATQHAEKLALMVVNIIIFLQYLFTPVIVVLNLVTGAILKLMGVDKTQKAPTVTEAELKTMVNVSHEEGVLEGEERRMINNVFNFGDAQASDVMTPRIKMIALDVTSTYHEVMEVFKDEKATQYVLRILTGKPDLRIALMPRFILSRILPLWQFFHGDRTAERYCECSAMYILPTEKYIRLIHGKS